MNMYACELRLFSDCVPKMSKQLMQVSFACELSRDFTREDRGRYLSYMNCHPMGWKMLNSELFHILAQVPALLQQMSYSPIKFGWVELAIPAGCHKIKG